MIKVPRVWQQQSVVAGDALEGRAPAARTLTRRQAARLRKRNSRLMSLEYFYQAKECLTKGDLAGAFARVARQPAMVGYVLRRLGSYLLRHAFTEPSRRPATKIIERVAARSRRLSRHTAAAASKR